MDTGFPKPDGLMRQIYSALFDYSFVLSFLFWCHDSIWALPEDEWMNNSANYNYNWKIIWSLDHLLHHFKGFVTTLYCFFFFFFFTFWRTRVTPVSTNFLKKKAFLILFHRTHHEHAETDHKGTWASILSPSHFTSALLACVQNNYILYDLLYDSQN